MTNYEKLDAVKEIERLADEACDKAFGNAEFSHAMINWGDLGCTEVALVFPSGEDEPIFRVRIEEASGDNDGFCEFVAGFLAENGFPGVEVETAWSGCGGQND